MYVPINNLGVNGLWRVDFIVAGNEPITIGYAETLDAAARIAGAMNGGDMDRILTGTWDKFVGNVQEEAPAPVIVDMLNEPPHL